MFILDSNPPFSDNDETGNLSVSEKTELMIYRMSDL